MTLNLPAWEPFSSAKNLLIAGMGGGFDVFCGLPIYFALKKRGIHVHLANYSFTDTTRIKSGYRLSENLVGVTADEQAEFVYAPELYLAQWFYQQGENVPIWAFQKTGARPLLDAYRALVDHLKIDTILLVDGGVDSLLRGDEPALGTIVEDTISLAAVNELEGVEHKSVVCSAFGAEQDILYANVLENMAALTRFGAFKGACALAPHMPEYMRYEEAVMYTQSQPGQDASVINSSVVSAVRGEFGNYHLTEKTRGSVLQISPLMTLYWFFDLATIADRSLIYEEIVDTDTVYDGFTAIARFLRQMPRRHARRLNL